MFDFATTVVGTKVYCASPSEDTHEVEHILSPQKHLIGSFFLASHFVKPPCDVVLSLPFAINLKSVGVAPRATSVCSDVISVFISEKGWDEVSKLRDPRAFYKYCGTFEDLSSKETNYVYMENSLYKENPKFPDLGTVNHSGVKFVKNMYSMHNVKSIKLRINRVAKSGPPCLKGVEVWGQPNAHNHPDTLSSFFSLAKVDNQMSASVPSNTDNSNIFKPLSLFASPLPQSTHNNDKPNYLRKRHMDPSNSDPTDLTNSRTSNNPINSTDSTNSTNTTNKTEMMNATNTKEALPTNAHPKSYDIPPEFIDPITYEVMREPVVLPSGHTVDKSTIIRHLASHTTDPFSRLAMELSDAKPDRDLQQEIESLLQSRKRKSDDIFSSFTGKGHKLGRLNETSDTPPSIHPLVARFAQASPPPPPLPPPQSPSSSTAIEQRISKR